MVQSLALVHPQNARLSADDLIDDVLNLLSVVHGHISLVLEASQAHPVDRRAELEFAREAAELSADLARRLHVLIRPLQRVMGTGN